MLRKSLLLVLAIGVFAAGDAFAREGFGFTKKAVVMNRLKPPVTTIGARRVKVTVTSERSENKDDAATLYRYVEDALLNGAGTLVGEKEKGDILVKVYIERLDSHESNDSKTETRYKKIGSHQEWDEKKKKYVTKDDYGDVSETVHVKKVSGTLAGSWDIADKNGKVIESGSLSQSYDKSFEDGTGAPAPSKVEDDLLKQSATMVASQLVPTNDRVSVIVPKGSFESLIPLAEMNAWDRYLAGVEAVPAKKDPRQEAYRQYALALGKEGLAYSSVEDRSNTVALLREAVAHYERAVKDNPGEKIFSTAYETMFSSRSEASLMRATTSLAAFEQWAGIGTTTTTKRATAKVAEKPPMSNQVLIDMAKAGLTDENLILAIDAADATDFDTTPNGLIALAKGGVSKNVIAHMQKKTARR